MRGIDAALGAIIAQLHRNGALGVDDLLQIEVRLKADDCHGAAAFVLASALDGAALDPKPARKRLSIVTP